MNISTAGNPTVQEKKSVPQKKPATVEPVKKRGRGRPPKGDQALTDGIEVRFSRVNRLLIEAAAQLDDVPLSAFVRDAAVAAAAKRIERKR